MMKFYLQIVVWSVAWFIASGFTTFGIWLIGRSVIEEFLILLIIPGLTICAVGVVTLNALRIQAKAIPSIDAAWALPYAALVWIACGTMCVLSWQ